MNLFFFLVNEFRFLYTELFVSLQVNRTINTSFLIESCGSDPLPEAKIYNLCFCHLFTQSWCLKVVSIIFKSNWSVFDPLFSNNFRRKKKIVNVKVS